MDRLFLLFQNSQIGFCIMASMDILTDTISLVIWAWFCRFNSKTAISQVLKNHYFREKDYNFKVSCLNSLLYFSTTFTPVHSVFRSPDDSLLSPNFHFPSFLNWHKYRGFVKRSFNEMWNHIVPYVYNGQSTIRLLLLLGYLYYGSCRSYHKIIKNSPLLTTKESIVVCWS